MNRRQIIHVGSVLFLFQAPLFLLTLTSAREIRQRSDGCGRNPLIALAAALGSGTSNLNEVLRAVKSNPDMWSEMRVLLRRYDDCIRAGDGLHYKRSEIFPSEYNLSPETQFHLQSDLKSSFEK